MNEEKNEELNATVKPSTWIETFTGVLLNPRDTFANMVPANYARLEGFGGAALVVFLVFFLDGVRMANVRNPGSAWLTAPLSVVGGFIMWLALAATIAIAASCFGSKPDRIRASCVAIGWSFAPWIFMAPLFCYQQLLGPVFVLFAALPGIWIFILQLTALTAIFQLRPWQVVALVFGVPMLLGIFQIMQFMQSLYVSFAALSR